MMLFWMEAYKRLWLPEFLDYTSTMVGFYEKYRPDGRFWKKWPEQILTLTFGITMPRYAIYDGQSLNDRILQLTNAGDTDAFDAGYGRPFLVPFGIMVNRFSAL
jgi:hypothetical protein